MSVVHLVNRSAIELRTDPDEHEWTVVLDGRRWARICFDGRYIVTGIGSELSGDHCTLDAAVAQVRSWWNWLTRNGASSSRGTDLLVS